MHCTQVPDELQYSRGLVVQWLLSVHWTHASKASSQWGVSAGQMWGVWLQVLVVSLHTSLVQKRLSLQLFTTQMQCPLGPGLMQMSTVQNSPSLQFALAEQGAVGHIWARATPFRATRKKAATTKEDDRSLSPCKGSPPRFHPIHLDSIVVTPQPLAIF